LNGKRRQKNVKFASLTGWEGQTGGILDPTVKSSAVTAIVTAIARTTHMGREAGRPVDVVSCGGTVTCWITAA
jgi:hypothetical protein